MAELLIVPCGIETVDNASTSKVVYLLIVPCGIETDVQVALLVRVAVF